MAKDVGLSVVAGLASALVFISVLTGGTLGVLLAYLVSLPLAMIGLSFGLRHVLLGSGVALAVVAVATPVGFPVFAVVGVLPVLVLVRQALQARPNAEGRVEWYPPGLLVAWLAVLAAALMVLGTTLLPIGGGGIEGGLRTELAAYLDQVLPSAPPEFKGEVLRLWAALFPAMLGSGWLLMAALNGVVAQWTVVKAGRAIRPTPAYARLELPTWLLAVVVVVGVAGVTASGDVGYLGRNAAVVLLWPYVFAGLAMVHGLVRDRPNRGLLLAFFYVTVFVLFRWSLVALAGLGLVRHWTRLRRLLAGRSQEEK